MIDEKSSDVDAPNGSPAYPADHIGWSLWQGAQIWHTRFIGEVRALGYSWFTLSSSTLLGNLSRKGATQKRLAERLGLSKQAVNQQIDELVRAGILQREIDSNDKRARIIRYTEKGNAALVDIDRIKLEIEVGFARIIGEADMGAIKRGIDRLALAQKPDAKKPASD